jgi:hypothetical protein
MVLSDECIAINAIIMRALLFSSRPLDRDGHLLYLT